MRRITLSRMSIFAVILISLIGLGDSTIENALGGESQTKQPSKITNIVEQLIVKCQEALATDVQDLSVMSNDVLHVTKDGKIELVFHAAHPTTRSQEIELEALGATIVSMLEMPPGLVLPPVGMIEAWVPFDKVEAAAALPWVIAVTPPGYGEADPHPTNPINSEGVTLHGADLLQDLGITGAGVMVGVISTDAFNVAQSQALNELPAVTVLNTNTTNTTDEGTAMLEIIHDMAPGAALLYDDGAGTAATGVLRHFNALTNLAVNGANVIAEDLAFASEPAFQQGLLAATAEAIASGGVSVHSSAGNRGTNHTARVQAVGTGGGPDGMNFGVTPPGCTNTPDNVLAIAPGGDTTFDVTLQQNSAGTSGARFTLQWSEPRAIFPTQGQGGFTDLNLYVMDANLTQCLGESVGVQSNGQGDTIEVVTLGPGTAGTAAKLVVDVQSTSSAVAVPILDLRWRRATAGNPGEDMPTRAGSLNPDSNYIGLATAAAAINANTNAIEGFSSGGPVQLGLTTICPGGSPGPCIGVAGPGLTSFLGPTWAAADGVSVSGVGGFGSPFFGTSASAPHAAACDALVREAIGNPNSPVGPIRDRLEFAATDIGPPGIDNVTGAGLLNCLAAIPAADVSIAKTDAPDPVAAGGELIYTLTVTNNGPGTADDVQVVDMLPIEVSYIIDDGGCAHAAGTVTCDIGELLPSESKDIKITMKVNDDLVDATGLATITNDATVTTLITPDPDTSNNSILEDTQVLPGCGGLLATLTGTPSNDRIVGTPANEVIAALAGNDSIRGGGGDDVICGGSGRDSIVAESGNDRLFGNDGNDNIRGGDGNDEIDGGPGRDRIVGGEGVNICINGENVKC